MKILILVIGLPGSGKSYFSERLALQLSAVHLQTDKVRKEMHLEGNYSDEDKLLVYKSTCDRAENLLKQGRAVIVDATFHREVYRELFFHMAAKLEIQVVIIWVEADQDTAKSRLKTSRKYSEADYEVYLRIKGDFDPPLHPYLHLTSTNSNIEGMLHKAVNYIKIGDDA